MSELTIRYLLDENIEVVIAVQLRKHGIDVTTVVQKEMLGEDDPVILKYATKQGRVVVSYDDDFTKLAKMDIEHAGIVFVTFRHRSIGVIVRALVHLAEYVSTDDMKDILKYL